MTSTDKTAKYRAFFSERKHIAIVIASLVIGLALLLAPHISRLVDDINAPQMINADGSLVSSETAQYIRASDSKYPISDKIAVYDNDGMRSALSDVDHDLYDGFIVRFKEPIRDRLIVDGMVEAMPSGFDFASDEIMSAPSLDALEAFIGEFPQLTKDDIAYIEPNYLIFYPDDTGDTEDAGSMVASGQEISQYDTDAEADDSLRENEEELVPVTGGRIGDDMDSDNRSDLHLTNIQEAWAITKGSKDVVVGIIDSGLTGTGTDAAQDPTTAFRKHEDIDYENSIVEGYNAVFDNHSTEDLTTGDIGAKGIVNFGTGTFMAGQLLGIHNNKIGTTGIAPNIKVQPFKIFDIDVNDISYGKNKVLANSFYRYKGILKAIESNVDIIQIGLGWTASFSELGLELCEQAVEKNIIVIAGAQPVSSESSTTDKNYPAYYDCVVGVAPTDVSMGKFSEKVNNIYSAYENGNIFVSAPAINVTGLAYSSTVNTRSGSNIAYGASYVVGAAALARSVYPDMTPLEFMEILADTSQSRRYISSEKSVKVNGRYYDEHYGWGLIDIGAVVKAAQSKASEPKDQASGFVGNMAWRIDHDGVLTMSSLNPNRRTYTSSPHAYYGVNSPSKLSWNYYPWENMKSSIKEVSIPNTVKFANASYSRSNSITTSGSQMIGYTSYLANLKNAFNECPNLSKVDLSGVVTTASMSADKIFDNCTSLTSIKLGDGWLVDDARFPNPTNREQSTGTFMGWVKVDDPQSINDVPAVYSAFDDDALQAFDVSTHADEQVIYKAGAKIPRGAGTYAVVDYPLYALTTTQPDSSVGEVWPPSQIIDSGQSQKGTISIKAASGYEIDMLKITHASTGKVISTDDSLKGRSLVPNYEVPVTSNCNVEVVFSKTPYSLSVNVTPQAGGTVKVVRTSGGANGTSSNETLKSGDKVYKGDVLSITPTPSSIEYMLGSLMVNGTQNGITYQPNGSYAYTVTAEDVSISAQFTDSGMRIFSVEALVNPIPGSTDAGGTVSAPSQMVNQGMPASVRIDANEGYAIDNIVVTAKNGHSSGSIDPAAYQGKTTATWSIASIDDYYKIAVTFKEVPTFAVTISQIDSNGQLKASSSKVSQGSSVTLEWTPNKGYELDVLTINNKVVEATGYSHIVSDVQSDIVASATFKRAEYLATIDKSDFGSSALSAERGLYETELTVYVKPSTGYGIAYLRIGGQDVSIDSMIPDEHPTMGSVMAYTFPLLDNTIIDVGYRIDQFDVDVSISDVDGKMCGWFGARSPQISMRVASKEDIQLYPTVMESYAIKSVHFVMGDVDETYTYEPDGDEFDYMFVLSKFRNGDITANCQIEFELMADEQAPGTVDRKTISAYALTIDDMKDEPGSSEDGDAGQAEGGEAGNVNQLGVAGIPGQIQLLDSSDAQGSSDVGVTRGGFISPSGEVKVGEWSDKSFLISTEPGFELYKIETDDQIYDYENLLSLNGLNLVDDVGSYILNYNEVTDDHRIGLYFASDEYIKKQNEPPEVDDPILVDDPNNNPGDPNDDPNGGENKPPDNPGSDEPGNGKDPVGSDPGIDDPSTNDPGNSDDNNNGSGDKNGNNSGNPPDDDSGKDSGKGASQTDDANRNADNGKGLMATSGDALMAFSMLPICALLIALIIIGFRKSYVGSDTKRRKL